MDNFPVPFTAISPYALDESQFVQLYLASGFSNTCLPIFRELTLK